MSIFVLGPFIDGVIEPDPSTSAPVIPGRQQIVFDDPPTLPGGKVFLKLVPPAKPDDIPPINVYAFHVPQPTVPVAAADRTPDWFFKSGAPSGSTHVGTADADGKFQVEVPGVKPSLVPYHVQTVIEYSA